MTIKEIAMTKPNERQLILQKMEFYAFVHYGMNTYTERQWGGVDYEHPSLFDPTELSTDQWASACQSAGMKGIIITAKHHDGFCLWQTKQTDFSIANSPWKGGKGDLLSDLSKSCDRYNLKLGIYLSPWDMHENTYGQGKAYDDYFVLQLEELLTNYGEIFAVWFDGACGEGKRQVYDWDRYYETIRRIQPNACIHVCGPDIRWCGNEAGHCRESEWSVVPASLIDNERIADVSQREAGKEFFNRINTDDQDLGSREAIRGCRKLVWYPAEVNTSIRPDWFYDKQDDSQVRSLDELLDLYYKSVGGNATFLLNIPPDKRGLFHENDSARLKELGDALKENFRDNKAAKAKVNVHPENSRSSISGEVIVDGNENTYWYPDEGMEVCTISLELEKPAGIHFVVLKENIAEGQRVEGFTIEALIDGEWTRIASGTVIGYKKICVINPAVSSKNIRVNIEKSRWQPQIQAIEIY